VIIMAQKEPNTTSQIFTVTKYELLRNLREKKLYAAVAISVAVSLSLVIIPVAFEFGLPPTVNDYFALPVGFVFVLIVICAAFFGSNSLLNDFHSKTGYVLFTNPIDRKSIWLGKFLAAESISIGIIGIYYLIIAGGALYNFQTLSLEILASVAFSFVVITTVLSITFLISSVFRGPTGAVVLVFLLFIFALPLMEFIITLTTLSQPWYSIVFSSKIIGNILEPQNALDMEDHIFFPGFGDKPDVAQSLLILGAYITASIAASLFLYQRKEMIER